MTDEQNIIFIGRKPIFSYVDACVTQLRHSTTKYPRIYLRARGSAISRCVDCVEVLKNKFLEGQIEVEKITTNTEKITTIEGEINNVSSIEIILIKKVEGYLKRRPKMEEKIDKSINKKEDSE